MEEATKAAYAALAKAQSQMTRARKDSKNPHFKSSYADLASVQDACMGPLNDNGFAVIQPTCRDDAGIFVRTILAHESGATLECRTDLLIGKNDMQGLGSAITYARRYGLLCMSGVAPDDDDGNAAVAQKQKTPSVDLDRLLDNLHASITAAADLSQLAEAFKAAQAQWARASREPFPPALITAKDSMKAALSADAGEEAPF